MKIVIEIECLAYSELGIKNKKALEFFEWSLNYRLMQHLKNVSMDY